MMIFTIDSENNIAAHASASEITDKGSEQFTSEKELAQLAADWPGSGRGQASPSPKRVTRAVQSASIAGRGSSAIRSSSGVQQPRSSLPVNGSRRASRPQ